MFAIGTSSRAAAGAERAQAFISEPSQSETTGEWTIYFSRRFEAPDGQLIGIVVSTI